MIGTENSHGIARLNSKDYLIVLGALFDVILFNYLASAQISSYSSVQLKEICRDHY